MPAAYFLCGTLAYMSPEQLELQPIARAAGR